MTGSDKELFYNSIADQWEGLIHKAETQKRLRIVFEELFAGAEMAGKQFLDAGCGLGFFSEQAAKAGADVTGIDIGDNLIKRATERSPSGKFMTASVSNLPFKDESFELVLSTEVIEHVEDSDKAVTELLRVLRPHGHLVLTTPNRVFKWMFDLLSLIRIRPYHGNENWYYRGQLRRIIEAQGGKILKERHFNFFYPCRPLDWFERFDLLRGVMINQGYLITK